MYWLSFLRPASPSFLSAVHGGESERAELHHDRGGDVGHHAERDDAHALEAAAREGVEEVEHAALLRLEQRRHARADRCPGIGTNDSKRNRISAPSVNHRRFLSSVALAKLARLMLAASCSAADAIDDP